MKVYISGKITGLDLNEARQLFDQGAAEVAAMGYTPMNPMELVPEQAGWDWKDYMLKDIEILFDCKGIYMLNNWGDSKGARIERAIAMEHGLEVIFQGKAINTAA